MNEKYINDRTNEEIDNNKDISFVKISKIKNEFYLDFLNITKINNCDCKGLNCDGCNLKNYIRILL